VHNLVPANYLTLCAATLPVGRDRLGMPVGLQLIAKGGDDERLVAIACAAERVLGTPREILGTPPMCKEKTSVEAYTAGFLAIADEVIE
jgi:aspartyl-tRNA(Asn)/glutamyl-tRNA(Gln) amidotransferase subunit A